MASDEPDLTPEQKRTLQTFRKELLDDGIISEKGDSLGTQHDHVLLRFLRARKYNIKNTKIMLKNCLEWRRTVLGVGIDELYRRTDPYEYPERKEVFKYWPIWYHKTDKNGRPINIQSLGAIDTTALYKVINPERFWETIVVTAEGLVREVLPGSSYAAGKIVDSTFIIIDLKDFGLGKFWQMKSLVKDSFQISQDYFPETMGVLVVINAPYSFAAIWSAVRPWLAKETQEKVHIFSTDYMPFLLEHVDKENLPEAFGGTCTCSDKGGCQFSNGGPWMEGRKERREKWLAGELPSPGLELRDSPKNNENDIASHRLSPPVSPMSAHHTPSAGEL